MFEDYIQVAKEEFLGLYRGAVAFLPKLLLCVLVFTIGWLIASGLRRLVTRLLKATKFDHFVQHIGGRMSFLFEGENRTPSNLIGKSVFYLFMLVVFTSLAQAMGWTLLTNEISRFFSYLPQLIGALAILIGGLCVAGLIRDAVRNATKALNISAGRLLSILIYYIFFALVLLTALRQAGIDTTLLSTNLLLILGAILLAAAVSYGYASRDILRNVLSTFYGKHTFVPGQYITIDGHQGTIIELNNQRLVLKLDNDDVLHLPTQLLSSKPVVVSKTKNKIQKPT